MSDQITRWLDESQRLTDDADYGPWEAYGRGGDGRPGVQSVKSLGDGGIVCHTGYGEADERAGLDARFIAESRTRFPQAVAALRAVMELHRQASDYWGGGCTECEQAYPCLTIEEVEAALGLEGDDHE